MKFPQFSARRWVLVCGVALAVPLTALAFSQHRGEPGGFGGPDMRPPHLRALNLSEAQNDKVFDLMHAQAPVMREKMKAARKAEEALREFAGAPDYSEAKARALADTAAQRMADVSFERLRMEHEIFVLLTPEQRQKLAELKASGRDRHRHGGKGPRGPEAQGGRPPVEGSPGEAR